MATTGEEGYLNLLRSITSQTRIRRDRTGTGTLSVFGSQLRFDLEDRKVPAMTTKRLAWKSCLEELLWFLRGATDASELASSIWALNSSRDFLDRRGLVHLPEGDIGAGYGFQWRHFGGQYNTCKDSYEGEGFDQIAYVERLLDEDPTSRRIMLSAWNPADLDRVALPPCHVMAQFYVDEGDLSCHLVMRSADCFLGLPFNIFSYSVLTHILAARHGLRAKELIVSIGDAHVYRDHLEAVRTQLERSPHPPPRLWMSDTVRHKPLDSLSIDDFALIDYVHEPAIRAPMSA